MTGIKKEESLLCQEWETRFPISVPVYIKREWGDELDSYLGLTFRVTLEQFCRSRLHELFCDNTKGIHVTMFFTIRTKVEWKIYDIRFCYCSIKYQTKRTRAISHCLTRFLADKFFFCKSVFAGKSFTITRF